MGIARSYCTKRLLCGLTLFCGMLTASAPALAETMLTPHRAEYKVSVSIFGGQLNTELRATPEGYVATQTIKTTGMSRMLASGSITDSATFERQPDGIRPQSFHTNDTLTRDKIRADISFDWANSEASGTVNRIAYQAALDGLAYDRVSLQYALMSDLLNGENSEQYVLFDLDEIRTIEVRNIGRRMISVPAGNFEAIGVQHQTANSKKVTTMWCVKELDYLPVMIEQYRKGKLKMRAELRTYAPLKT